MKAAEDCAVKILQVMKRQNLLKSHLHTLATIDSCQSQAALPNIDLQKIFRP